MQLHNGSRSFIFSGPIKIYRVPGKFYLKKVVVPYFNKKYLCLSICSKEILSVPTGPTFFYFVLIFEWINVRAPSPKLQKFGTYFAQTQ